MSRPAGLYDHRHAGRGHLGTKYLLGRRSRSNLQEGLTGRPWWQHAKHANGWPAVSEEQSTFLFWNDAGSPGAGTETEMEDGEWKMNSAVVVSLQLSHAHSRSHCLRLPLLLRSRGRESGEVKGTGCPVDPEFGGA